MPACIHCVSSHLRDLWKESFSIFSVSSDQVVVDGNKVSPSSSLLKAEEIQFFQLLLVCLVLQPLTILVALCWTH